MSGIVPLVRDINALAVIVTFRNVSVTFVTLEKNSLTCYTSSITVLTSTPMREALEDRRENRKQSRGGRNSQRWHTMRVVNDTGDVEVIRGKRVSVLGPMNLEV